MSGIEQRLVTYILDTEFEDLPVDIVDIVKNLILTNLGTAIAGAGVEGCKELVDQISEAKSLGEALRGASFVSSTGKVSATPPSEKHIETPHHRYYGDE